MYNFLDIVKEIDKVANGIWLKYHIEKIDITETEYGSKVTAVIVNDWITATKEKNIFTFDLVNPKTLVCTGVECFTENRDLETESRIEELETELHQYKALFADIEKNATVALYETLLGVMK